MLLRRGLESRRDGAPAVAGTRLRPTGAALAAAAALAGCFDPPVAERLQLRFFANGAYEVAAAVEIREVGETGNPALERRLADVRRALEEGGDEWSRRFAALQPAPAERLLVERSEGSIRRVTRAALLDDPAALAGFFADTALQVSYEMRDGRAELVIVPGAAGRANRRQRETVERALESWSAAVADHLAAVEALYTHLERQPERARACLGAVYSDLLDEGQAAALPEPTAAEAALVERLGGAMERVVEVLLVPDGADHSLDELSRLVFDPFPARLTVTLPGPALESEGFREMRDAGALRVPGFSLWDALRSLDGRWVSPDPAAVYVGQRRDGGVRSFDLAEHLGRARRAVAAPAASEVRAALLERLQPQPVYRAVWTIDPEAELPPDW